MRLWVSVSVVALIVVCGAAFAQSLISSSSAPDPYVIVDFPGRAGWQLTNGATQYDPRLGGGKTAIMLVAGESTIANYDATNNITTSCAGAVLYTAANTTAQQLDIYNGGVYGSIDPLASAQACGGSLVGRLADKLINAAVFSRVIAIPMAVGGTKVADWAPGGTLAGRIAVGMARAHAVSLDNSPDVFLIWQCGVNDAVAGTSSAAYQSSFNAMVAANSNVGLWFVALSTYNGATNATIRTAQAAVVNSTTILSGPDIDTLTGTACSASACRQASDNTHFTAAGSNSAAALWETTLAGHSWP